MANVKNYVKLLSVIIILIAGLWATGTTAKGPTNHNGSILFSNPEKKKNIHVQLITPFGTINNRSREFVSRLSSIEKKNQRSVLLHPRLFLMLQRVSDQFAGHPLELISGHRNSIELGNNDSHNLGRAVDFRVVGVDNEKLYDFVRTLPKCGTGLYPKSNFVHLDVREESTTWVDYDHSHKTCQIAKSNEKSSGREIEFISVWDNKTAKLQLVSESGLVNSRSRQIISDLSGSRGKAKRNAILHRRLILMLNRVAEKFPGHRFELISGFRPGGKGFRNYHQFGRAMDFRLEGVSNEKLYKFVKTLPNCGTGYYPNSVFVHLDVRDKSTTWVDYSGVGEEAQYQKSK